MASTHTPWDLVANGTNKVCALVDGRHRVLAVSEAYAKHAGRSRQELVGTPLQDLFDEEAYRQISPAVVRALRGEKAQTQLWLRSSRQGSRAHEVRISPYESKAGESAVLVAFAEGGDRSPVPHGPDTLSDFAALVDGCFWETNACSELTYVSPDTATVILGRSADDLVGKAVFCLGEEWQRLTRSHAAAPQPLARFEYIRRDESNRTGDMHVERVLRVSYKPMTSALDEFAGYRGVVLDVTEASRLATQLSHQAQHDSLTGLINRRHFEQKLAATLVRAKQNHSQHALCFMDLDMFKKVNDTAGHVAGDELLRQLARLMQSKTRGNDLLSRLGGDEFCLLLENCALNQAERVAQKLIDAVNQLEFNWGGHTFHVGMSVGVVPITAESRSSTRLLSLADKACYAAKGRGKNFVSVTAG